MQTRKCHAVADANADADANTNGIRGKNHMSPSPFGGGHNERKYVIFCIVDNFQHLAIIEHNWIPKILIYIIAHDKIYIIQVLAFQKKKLADLSVNQTSRVWLEMWFIFDRPLIFIPLYILCS